MGRKEDQRKLLESHLNFGSFWARQCNSIGGLPLARVAELERELEGKL